MNDEQVRLAYERFRKAGPNWVPDCVKYGYSVGQCDCGRVKEYKGPKCDVGCLDEDCLVLMLDGFTKKPIEKLQKGDRLYFGGTVKTVVRFHIDNKSKMCEVGPGILVTEWHPMCEPNSDEWVHPCKRSAPKYTYVNTVVDLILEGSHIIPIVDLNDQIYKFVSMAHNVVTPKILEHPYWGTDEVLSDLERHPEYYKSGYLDIKDCELLYDEDGVIYRMEF